MLPFVRMLEYGNIAPSVFLGISEQITFNSTGYNPPGRNYTSSCSTNVEEFPYVYFYGGITGTGGGITGTGSTYLNDFFYYNASDNTFYQIPSSNLRNLRSTPLVYTPDGYIYGFGGANSSNNASSQFFRHKVGTNSIEIISNDSGRPPARYNHAGVCIGNEIFYFGGQSSSVKEVIVAYNYITKVWRTVRSGITTPTLNVESPSVIFYEGLVYLVIGSTMYNYDPSTNAFTQVIPSFSPITSSGAGFIIVDGTLYYILGTFVTKREPNGTWTRIRTNTSSAYYTWYGYIAGKREAYSFFGGGGVNDRSTVMYKFT